MLTHQTFAPGSTRDGCRHRIKQDFSYPRHFADNHQTVQEYLAPVNNSMELKAKDSGFYKVCCFALYKVSVAIIFIFAVVYFGNIAHDYQIGQLRLGYHNSRNLQSTVSISIPPLIDSNLCDIEEARGGGVTHVTPFYWHIPKSGGTSIQDYALDCLKLTVASEVGVLDGHQNDKVLQKVLMPNDRRYVNVDTTTIGGISKAKSLGLAPSQLADIVFSGYIHEGASMFNSQYRGVMFAIFRHPIRRAVSIFYYLQIADWEPTYDPSLKHMTLAQYARSARIEDNWMTRMLLNKMSGRLVSQDLYIAMEILKRKFIVGLETDMEESMKRFEFYFGWSSPLSNAQECKAKYLLNSSGSNKNNHPAIVPGSQEWNLVADRNRFDIELYGLAKDLFFGSQAKMFNELQQQR